MRLRCVFLFAMFIAYPAAKAQVPDSSALKATAVQLFNMSGGGTVASRVIEQITSAFKQRFPDVPASFWDSLRTQLDSSELTTLALRVYIKHFTREEIQAIMKFTKTPAGEKLIDSMPEIAQQMSAIGQEWGTRIGQRTAQKLQEGGYLTSPESK